MNSVAKRDNDPLGSSNLYLSQNAPVFKFLYAANAMITLEVQVITTQTRMRSILGMGGQ